MDKYPIPRASCSLGFLILLQRVEDLFCDVPDVLELLLVDDAHHLCATNLAFVRRLRVQIKRVTLSAAGEGDSGPDDMAAL